ncbi:hypothetical protein AGMMS49940_11990 [Spirochaetia bacterium]|nr:hypothetical protein AGMMS49940_11990 [Spirochaetia bacterium]
MIFTALTFPGPLSAQDESAAAQSEAPAPAAATDAPDAAPSETPPPKPAAPEPSPAAIAPASAVPAPPLPAAAGGAVTITITAPADALSFSPAQPGAASAKNAEAAPALSNAEQSLHELEEDAEELGVVDYIIKIGIALGIIALQVLLIWLVWQKLFKWLTQETLGWGQKNIKPLNIKKLHLLSVKQILGGIEFLLRILKYVVTVFQLFLTLPIVFSLFPATKNLADTLIGFILHPLKKMVIDTVSFVPNLITIVITLWVTKYVIRFLKFFTTQIEKEKLVIPGFYADWAQPTFNILRVLVYAFTVVVIYPHLPGSGSAVFQGVSVFIGIIFSLGSSSAIGNLIAGIVITYMRLFKVGDRIKFQDVTGFVVERSLMVIRIRTHKNEFVTFPNTMALNSSIVNYNTSAHDKEEGLTLYAEVTMGYAVPWPQVHEILLAAARRTANTELNPSPYVLQTALDDFYARYQINVYTRAVEKVPRIYSELYQNLQDGFREAGISLTAPAYQIWLPPEARG